MIKRPLVCILAAYVTGILLALCKLSLLIIICILILSYFLLYLLMYPVKLPMLLGKHSSQSSSCPDKNITDKATVLSKRDRFLWFLPLFLLLGCLIMREEQRRPALYDAFGNEVSCTLTGSVAMIVEKQWGDVLYLKNNRVWLDEKESYLCENIMVYRTTTERYNKSIDPSLSANLFIGNQITVFGTLEKFSAATNPGQFDEQLYYKIENIDFKLQADRITVTNDGYSAYHVFLSSLKSKLIEVYSHMLGDQEAGVLIAMLLGEKYLLGEEIKELYQINGISHVLAISGLHVSLIGMTIFHLLKKLKLPIVLATFLSIFFIYSYGVLTNLSVSTSRAILMMILLLLSTIFGKTYDMLSAISLSALLILMQNPYQLFGAGFLLSYGAVLGIAVLLPRLTLLFPTKNPLLLSLYISISAQLTTLPAIVYFFFQVPVYGVLTNLIILPFVTLLTLTSLLAGIVGVLHLPLGIFLIGGSNYILQFYEWICRLISYLPKPLLTVGRPDALRILLYGLLVLSFTLIVTRYKKKRSILLLVTAVVILLMPNQAAGLEITFLDVGQGDGIYMKTVTGTTYLIDGGSQDVYKVGKNRLEPFLLSKGRDYIDYVIITHPDSDHTSGIIELIQEDRIRIGCLLLPNIEEKDEAYQGIETLAGSRRIPVQYLSAGDCIKDGELSLFCLHPSKGYKSSSQNAYSVVLSVSYGDFDMLLTGDLEEDGEMLVLEQLKSLEIWNRYDEKPSTNYDVLKCAHHGSKNSTYEDLLKLIRPELSIISCGKNNRYGHPHTELLERLEDIGSEVLITNVNGAIMIITDGTRIRIDEFLK